MEPINSSYILGWWIYRLCCFYGNYIQSAKQMTLKKYFGRLTPANTMSKNFRLTYFWSFNSWVVYHRSQNNNSSWKSLTGFSDSFFSVFLKTDFVAYLVTDKLTITGEFPSVLQSEIQGMIQWDHLF